VQHLNKGGLVSATDYFEVAAAASKGKKRVDTQILTLFAQAAKDGDLQAQAGMKQLAEKYAVPVE